MAPLSPTPVRPRAYLLANRNKEDARAAFDHLRAWIADRDQLAGADLSLDPAAIVSTRPDRLIVLGGDGTILAAGRLVANERIPIAGVNLGKLGYLAAYAEDDIRDHFDAVMTDEALVSDRMMISVTVRQPGGPIHESIAINDCVLHAGPPFRMLTLEVSVDGQILTTISGDGLIVATPTGSTAHNMAAGGPILEPEVSAIVLSPICPHSLAHRPVVMAGSQPITVTVVRANEGSAAMIDGQVGIPTPAGTTVTITRGAQPFRLVRHPERSSWQVLVRKLKWGQGPT